MLESKNTPSLAKCLNLRYQRPELVTEGYSADEVSAFASHFNRPVISPRAAAPLPEGVMQHCLISLHNGGDLFVTGGHNGEVG